MYTLPPERENVLKSLFNPDVLAACREHMAPISLDLREKYFKQITQYYHTHTTTRPFIWIKKSRPNYPYSLLMVNDEPFLVLPTPADWKVRPQSNAAPKTLISLTTGELKFLKVYRPKDNQDTYPAASSAKDLQNRHQLGEETSLHTRNSKNGVKHYLLMPHYGKSFEKFLDDPKITPSHILDALLQVAEQIKKMHDKGVLHLDLKPSNMMYDARKNVARLIDFETMVPDQTVVPESRGTIRFMHPERLIQVSPTRVIRQTGNITCTKGEDIFTFLRAIEDTLFIAEWKEKSAMGKTVLTLALREFLEEAYQGLNLDGSRTAKPLQQMPTIDRLISMLKNTRDEYQQVITTQVKPPLPKIELPHFVPQFQAMPKMPSPRREHPLPQYTHAAPQPQNQASPPAAIHYQYQASQNTPSPPVMPPYRPKW